MTFTTTLRKGIVSKGDLRVSFGEMKIIFTDGSKPAEVTGVGVYSQETGPGGSFHLGEVAKVYHKQNFSQFYESSRTT